MSTRVALTFIILAGCVSAKHELCGQYETYSSPPYIFNNNAWNKDDAGSVCTYVSSDPSASNNAWYSIWQWTADPPAVRAYPHIELESDALPLKLGSLFSLRVSASWSFSPTSLIPGASRNPTEEPNQGALAANDVQANVVLDVFGDANEERSRTPARQKYEFMVWVAQFGKAAQPIGNDTPNDPPIITTVEGTNFTLYNGTNSNGQEVFSWLAATNLTTFNLDVAPLFGFLVYANMVPADTYIGTVQFGTETFFASNTMNFSVQAFHAEMQNTTNGGSDSSTTTVSLPSATQVSGPTMTGHKGGACSLKVLNDDSRLMGLLVGVAALLHWWWN